MHRFLQLHILTSYPPSNLNRDDLGRPKTAMMGGATRLRVSSQSLKRAWRTSEIFTQALGGYVGVRTKEKGNQIAKTLIDKGVEEKQAVEWAQKIAGQFGKLKDGKNISQEESLHIEQLAHFSPEELEAIDSLVEQLAERNIEPTDEQLQLLRNQHSAADIALFGRMLAANPRFNTEAAAQVAHAVTVHKVAVEDDFFTAVDDLNSGEEDLGAGHMGETEFGAGLFYLYICVDRDLLLRNLGGDAELMSKTLSALVEAVTTVSPTGHQNSFASRARASYVLAEVGDQQPRSLSVAFLEPVAGGKMLEASVDKLNTAVQNMDKVYGECADLRRHMNAHTGEGSLKEITACSVE